MNYPGNPALAPELQERLRSTFEQAMDLAEAGKRQEALLGCDFILGLDPQFRLAKLLRERLGAAAGPIGVDDLRLELEPMPDWGTSDRLLGSDDQIAAGEVDFGSLPPLDDDFGSLPGLDASFDPAPPASDPLGGQLQALFDRRQLQELFALAGQNHAAVMASPELRELVERGQSLLEAEPFVLQFVAQARAAQGRGELGEVARLLDKARSLDPDHPAISELAGNLPRAAVPGVGYSNELELEAPDLDQLPSFELAPIEDEPAFPAPVDSPDLASLDFGAAGGPNLASSAAFGELEGGFEGDPRVSELLADGQTAYDRGDYQSAIDSWSRIFLIDIDSQEAAERIDQARRMKAEVERQVEETFQSGVGHLERGDYTAASQAFRQVLELQPGHLAAKEFVQQIESGLEPAAPRRSESPGGGSGSALTIPGEDQLSDLKEEILVPPEPGTELKRSNAGPIMAAKKGRGARRRFMMVGIPVLLVALAGGWWLFTNRGKLFPNAEPPPPAVEAAPDPVERAKKLHEEGKTALAITQLKRQPESPEIKALIAAWEAELNPQPPAEDPAAVEARTKVEKALAFGEEKYAAGEFLAAKDAFERVEKLGPLAPAVAEKLAEARKRTAPLAGDLNLIAQGETERALASLWRKHQAEPNNRDVVRLMVDSYFNLGIRDLQRGSTREAAAKLREGLNLAPDDAVLERHYLLAQAYSNRNPDLLYRTYVKYLATR